MRNLLKMMATVAVTAALAMPVAAQTLDEIAGPWNLHINAMGREMDMQMMIGQENGQATVSIQSPQGSQDATNVSYEGNTLKWTTKMGPAELPLEVTVEGDTFAGSATTPFGEVQLSGTKLSEEDIAKAAAQFDALLGDWEVSTEHDGNHFESEMRFLVEQGQLTAEVIMEGVESRIDRLNYDEEDKELRWFVPLPYVSDEPAHVNVTLAEDMKSFTGTVESETFGEIAIEGEMIDTTKLVLSPYDDPSRILGEWTVDTDINGETGTAKVNFYEEDDRLKATISTDAGELKSDSVDYKIINDNMSVARIHVVVPDAGTEPLTFELIVNDDTFEGEEITSDEIEFLVSGSKVQ